MLLNSPTFIFFIGLVAAIFYFFPHRYRWLWLLGISYFWYLYIAPAGTVLLCASYLITTTLVAYLCGLGIGKYAAQKKKFLAIGVLINIGILFFVKYTDFLLEQFGGIFQVTIPKIGLRLPAGLSFYIFMTVTYMVDVYRGKMGAEPHLGNFGAYVAYFPKILAGPIERARNFLPQMRQKIQFDPEKATQGLQLLILGLFKKVVIADRISPFVAAAYSKANFASPFELTLATYLFAFQIYCDFSGYTDIARGAAKLMGIDLMENFKRPFLSKSPPEFWSERWHISLGTWFRDYMYFPLGGSKVSWPRHYFNLMMVFAVSGFWHAGLGYGVSWAFMIWGAINGIYAWVSAATAPFWKKVGEIMPKVKESLVLHILRVLFTFHLILFTLVFFRANSTKDAFTILTRVYKALGTFPMLLKIYKFTTEHYIAFILIALLMLVEIIDERKSIWERLRTKPVFIRWGFYYILIFGLIMLGKWGLSTFIYMQF